MKNKKFHISLKCLFCSSELKGNTGKEYKSEDMIRCQECGESNDYDSLIDVAVEEGKVVVVNHANREISKIIKDAFKK